jgi:hypothetical protein
MTTYGLFLKGGSIGEQANRSGTPSQTFDDKAAAQMVARRFNKMLTPGERKYYGLRYFIKAIPALSDKDA